MATPTTNIDTTKLKDQLAHLSNKTYAEKTLEFLDEHSGRPDHVNPLTLLADISARTGYGELSSASKTGWEQANALILNIKKEFQNISDPDDWAKLQSFIDHLNSFGADARDERPYVDNIKSLQTLENSKNASSQAILAAEAVFDPMTSSFVGNPLAYFPPTIPSGGNRKDATFDNIGRILDNLVKEQQEVQEKAETFFHRNNQAIIEYAQQVRDEAARKENFLTSFRNHFESDFQSLIQRGEAKLQGVDRIVKTAADFSNQTAIAQSFGYFAQVGVSVVKGKMAEEMVKVRPDGSVIDDLEELGSDEEEKKDEQLINRVQFDHLSFQEMRDELDRVERQVTDALDALHTEDPHQKATLETILKNIKNLRTGYASDPAEYDRYLQDQARGALLIRTSALEYEKSSNVVAPNWEELRTKLYDQDPDFNNLTSEQQALLDKSLEYRSTKRFFDLYMCLGLSFYSSNSDRQIEDGFRNKMKVLDNDEFKKIIGDDEYDRIKQLYETARSTLLNPVSRIEYDNKERYNRRLYEDVAIRIEARKFMDSTANYREDSRQKLLSQENKGMSWLDRQLNQIDWVESTRSPIGKTMSAAGWFTAAASSPWGLTILGTALYFGGSAFTPWVIGAASTATIGQVSTGATALGAYDFVANGISDRVMQQLNIAYETKIKTDFEGYLKIGDKADSVRQCMVQYLLDNKNEFGSEYVETLVYEILRNKSQLRFDFQFTDDGMGDRKKLEKQIRAKLSDKTMGSMRFSLLLGEVLPPESVFDGDWYPDIKVPRVSESDWQKILQDDPDFEKFFVHDTGRKKTRHNPATGLRDIVPEYEPNEHFLSYIFAQPTATFEAGADIKKMNIMFPVVGIGALSDAQRENASPEKHRIKRRLKNFWEVVELGDKHTNARVYQISIGAEATSDKAIDGNINALGIFATKDSYGCAEQVFKKADPTLYYLTRARREKKAA